MFHNRWGYIPKSLAALFTGISPSIKAIANASNSSVKPLPDLDQGTATWRTFPSLWMIRGTLQWMKHLCWKKCKCCQLRSIVSCTLHKFPCGSLNLLPCSNPILICNSMLFSPCSLNSTSWISHGGSKPKAIPNISLLFIITTLF